MKVSVIILCYNLEKYIKRAIEGALMQKTNFDFEVIVLDDGSTDKSHEIIKGYEGIRLITHKVNKGLIKSRIESFNAAKGGYLCTCDGDDYWTDEMKLQKQVDFLDLNQDCGLVHTGYSICNEIKGTFEKIVKEVYPEGSIFERLLMHNGINTSCAMFRRLFWDNVDIVKYSKLHISEDLFLWFDVAYYSNIGYIPDFTSVYTKRRGSMMGFKDYEKGLINTICSFVMRYEKACYYKRSKEIKKQMCSKWLKLADIQKNEHLKEIVNEYLKILT